MSVRKTDRRSAKVPLLVVLVVAVVGGVVGAVLAETGAPAPPRRPGAHPHNGQLHALADHHDHHVGRHTARRAPLHARLFLRPGNR